MRRSFLVLLAHPACEIITLLGVLVVLIVCALVQVEYSAAISTVAVCACIVILCAGMEARGLRAADISVITSLAALAAAGRIACAPLPSFKPLSAIAIVAGAVFGRRCGFLVGALAALVSNFFFGQGPWTPWQMYAWGLVGYFAGVLGATQVFKYRSVVVVYGFLSGYIYGFILNAWSILGFFHATNFLQILGVYASAFPFDTIHACATAFFLMVLYVPWAHKLTRIRRKYALMQECS